MDEHPLELSGSLPPEIRKQAEDLLFAQEELAKRRANDSLLTFVPHKAQQPFIDAVMGQENDENWFICANRTGKTDAGSFCGSKLARFGLPPAEAKPDGYGKIQVTDRATSGWVACVDFPTCRDVVQPKYFDNGHVPPGQPHAPFIPEREVAPNGWNKQDQILKLRNGSLIGFKSYDSSPDKFQGAGKDWVHFDEEPPKPHYDETSIRVEAGRKLRIFGTCTLLPPEGMAGGVSWLFAELIRPFQRKTLRPGIGLFGGSIYDNPHIAREEIAKLEAKYPPDSVIGRIRLGGEWLPGLSGARAYTAFQGAIHIKEQAPALPRHPLVWAFDFNVSPFISHVGQRINRTFHIYTQLLLEEGSVPEMADLFKAHYPRHLGELHIHGDATSNKRNVQSREGDYTALRNEMVSYGAPIRMKVPASNPNVTDRVAAVNSILRDHEGVSHVEIDPSCEELIQDFEEVLLNVTGGIRKVTNPKDPYFRRTHASDGVGYWIAQEEPVRPADAANVKSHRRIKRPKYGFAQA